MKTQAVMALSIGDVLASDVLSYKNELLFSAGTKIDETILAKLNRHSIMAVDIMEPIDYATTHFERVRFSDDFRKFEKVYLDNIPKYKTIIDGLIQADIPINIPALFSVYTSIASCAKTGEHLLDYLYNMLPSEDDMTYAHCLNAALIAGVFGTWLGLSNEEKFILIETGFLYDVGKILLPLEIIWKPTRLTDVEFELIKTHTIRGFNLIKDQKLHSNVIKATLQHHERCDGTGYPSKLKENQIDKYAQIISIVDAYDAMTSARTYRPSLPPFEVISNFENTARFYSPVYLKPILQKLANSQVGLMVRLSDDSVAEVYQINESALSRPRLKKDNYVIDLSLMPELKITGVL